MNYWYLKLGLMEHSENALRGPFSTEGAAELYALEHNEAGILFAGRKIGEHHPDRYTGLCWVKYGEPGWVEAAPASKSFEQQAQEEVDALTEESV